MLNVKFESASENRVLISKGTLEKLIQLASQVDEIAINEICDKTQAERGSLQGIWKGSQISEKDLLDARGTLFTYEEP